jgi:hypothetical protein
MDIYEFIHNYGYKDLQGKQIDVCGEICFINERFFTPEEIREHIDIECRIKQGRKPYFRLYGGATPNTDLVRWIYPTCEVINE